MTENHEAWEEYLRGRDNFGRFIFRTLSKEDCDAAIQNFKHAIELDPVVRLHPVEVEPPSLGSQNPRAGSRRPLLASVALPSSCSPATPSGSPNAALHQA